MAEQRRNLEPTPYHRALVAYLKNQEPELWQWFSSAQARTEYTESLRLELLKSTYRLDATHHPELIRSAEEAKALLGLDLPLTLYQAQNSSELNAMLYFIPGEAHVVLSGPVLSLLSPPELQSVLGHELAHYLLWGGHAGEFLVADRLLQSIAQDPRAARSHIQSARRYRLYTEIFADRGSLEVTRDPQIVVAGLVKMQTGLQQVSGAGYLSQADEIFARSDVKTEEISHPEAFIRARAIRLWAETASDVESQISRMIDGPCLLDTLDLTGQAHWTQLLERFLQQLLRPRWFQTAPVLAHARLFFAGFQPATEDDPKLVSLLRSNDSKLRELLSYVLLDFVVADPELEELPLAAAWLWAERLEIADTLEKLLVKELKLKARELKRLKQDAENRVDRAEETLDGLNHSSVA